MSQQWTYGDILITRDSTGRYSYRLKEFVNMTKQCGTCKEASSTQLPVSEVCRQCHDYSRWCQTVPAEIIPDEKAHTWVTNWFACSECGEPTDYKRTSEDGYHHGYCKQCKKVVRLRIDSEASTANVQDGLSMKSSTVSH